MATANTTTTTLLQAVQEVSGRSEFAPEPPPPVEGSYLLFGATYTVSNFFSSFSYKIIIPIEISVLFITWFSFQVWFFVSDYLLSALSFAYGGNPFRFCEKRSCLSVVSIVLMLCVVCVCWYN